MRHIFLRSSQHRVILESFSFRDPLPASIFSATSLSSSSSWRSNPQQRDISNIARERTHNLIIRHAPDVKISPAKLRGSILEELSATPNFSKWHTILTGLCRGAEDRYVPADEWETAVQESRKKDNHKDRQAFFGSLMSLACSFRFHQCGASLLDFLHSSKTFVNVSVASNYVKLCGRLETPDFEEKILAAYAHVKRISPADIYDMGTAENLIAGLYRTSRWEECLKLLDIIEFTGRPSPTALSYVITGAFAHDHPSTALRLLKQLSTLHGTFGPAEMAFTAWFAYAKSKGLPTVMEMLTFTRDYEWFIPLEVARDLKAWFEKEQGWMAKFTTLSPRGECAACSEYMKPITITRDEFEKLRENFVKSVIEGTDVFLHTNPAELKRYRDFVEKNAPFDLVVDGLNVAYFQNSSNHDGRSLARQLLTVTEHLLHVRGKRILILGRMHMKRWPKSEMSRLSSLASLFFAENMSQDDPFILYAALYSGLGCNFLSGDLMRDHRFKLAVKDVELRKTFLKWQRTHQMQLFKVYGDHSASLKAPMKYSTVTQWTESSIHVPYLSGLPLGLHELPPSWLCLTKKLPNN
ncbi:Mitochondrial ribonuclease P protein 3 [Hypsibius exemplaris]|uniref:Mitochondrial ribonuclease P catalytic subunit n=1 Tax=Hypsibius exemplaris TaxID=2072580 RepID=A0A1W0X871_HYPEX|nr:Mitochondrial ribonuclease P protein 3 [Hypsibius exemplaris]